LFSEQVVGISAIGVIVGVGCRALQRVRLCGSDFDIAKIEESEVSIMPEWLLEKLTPQQLRDLFAYLCR